MKEQSRWKALEKQVDSGPSSSSRSGNNLTRRNAEFMKRYYTYTSEISPDVLQGLKDLRKTNPEWFNKLESLTPTDDTSQRRMEDNAKFVKD